MPEPNVYEIRFVGDAESITAAAEKAKAAVEGVAVSTGKAEKSTALYEGTTRGLMRSVRLAVYQLSGELNPALAATVFALDRAALSAQLTGGRLGALAAGATIVGTGLALLLKHLNDVRKEADELAETLLTLDPGVIGSRIAAIAKEFRQMARDFPMPTKEQRGQIEAWGIVPETFFGPEGTHRFQKLQKDIKELQDRWMAAFEARKRAQEEFAGEDVKYNDLVRQGLQLEDNWIKIKQDLAAAENTVRSAMQNRLQVEAQLIQLRTAGPGAPGSEGALALQIKSLKLEAESLRAAAAAEMEVRGANVPQIKRRLQEQLEITRLRGEVLKEQQREAQIAWNIRQVAPLMRGAEPWIAETQAEREELEGRPVRAVAAATQLQEVIRSLNIEMIGDETQRALAELDNRYLTLSMAVRRYREELGPLAEEFERLINVRKLMISIEERERPRFDNSMEALLGTRGAAQHSALMSAYKQASELGIELTEEMKRRIQELVRVEDEAAQRSFIIRMLRGEARAGTAEKQFAAGVQLGFLQLQESAGTFGENIATLMQGIGSAMSRGLEDTFFNVVTGRARDLVDVFRQVGYAIVREMTSMSAKMATRGLFGEAGGGGGLLGSLFGSLFGGGGAGMMTVEPGALMLFQRGGVVPGPTGAPNLAVVHGGEEITPASARKGGGSVTVINLSDRDQLAAIVAQEMSKGREVIVNDVVQGLRGNSAIRRGVRRFG